MKSPSQNADTAPVPHRIMKRPQFGWMAVEQKTRPKSDFVARVRGALIEASAKESAGFLLRLPARLVRLMFRLSESGAADSLPF